MRTHFGLRTFFDLTLIRMLALEQVSIMILREQRNARIEKRQSNNSSVIK